MKRCTLLYIITSVGLGGAQVAMTKLLNNLNDAEWDITVAYLVNDGKMDHTKLLKKNIRIIRQPLKSKFDFGGLLRLAKLIRSENFDIIVSSLYHATIFARTFKIYFGRPRLVSWEHNENLGPFWRVLLNRLTRNFSDLVIADSLRVETVIKEKIGLDVGKLQVIPIAAIDISDYDALPNFPRPRDQIVIGSVGRLVKAKGFQYLIEVARLICEKNPQVEFRVAGDGPEYGKLHRMIKNYGIDSNFKLIGYCSDIPAFLSELDIYVQPSLWEGLCITVIEAMAAKLPVVAFDVGGVRESIIHAQTGYLVKACDVIDMKNKVLYLVNNPEVRKAMGEKGYKVVTEKYNLKDTLAAFEGLLKSMCR